MHRITRLLIILECALCVWMYDYDSEKPCIPLQAVPGNSIVSVCNATYCDTIIRVKPSYGTYVVYTSSEAGLRFKKTFGRLRRYLTYTPGTKVPVLDLDPTVLYQEICGFGGAVTDSVAYNWNSLRDPQARQNLIDSYFSNKGLEYNMIRIPIGGTDFSLRPYAYDSDHVDDKLLQHFSLEPEDYKLKIPFIKACMEVSTAPIRAVASLWSPPAWMKTSNSLICGYLKKEYYQTLADYFYKFIDSYNGCGIPIWGVTVTNEPLNKVYASANLNRLEWTVDGMASWIIDNLGPTIRNSTYSSIKIITGDCQRFTVPLWFNILIGEHPSALQYIDGIGVHFYYDRYIPASQLTQAVEDHPDKFILYTEASSGLLSPPDRKVDLGNWTRAEYYAYNILEDLNHQVVGWIDWNLCLNETGGPTWSGNTVDSAIIVSEEKQEFYKQPMFYAIGHFSKFIPRGSRRLKAEMRAPAPVAHAAFLTPDKTIVVVLLNKGSGKKVIIVLGSDSAAIYLEPKSFTTVEFPYQSVQQNARIGPKYQRIRV